jgi:hypothetical protein
MSLSYNTTCRTNRETQVLNAIDGSTNAGILTIYNGTKPAAGGTATTALAVFNLGATPATKPSGSVASGVLTLANITSSTAAATGTATWFRITDSASAWVVDGTVTATGGGGDLTLNSTAISSGQTVSITNGATITEGNA